MAQVLVQPDAAVIRRLTTALQDTLRAGHALRDFSAEGTWLGGSIEADNTTVYPEEYRAIVADARKALDLIQRAESAAFMLGLTLHGEAGIPEQPQSPLR